ncbi:hypothetical protein DFH09DRAFT_1090878 [Mycena vulgaris]|nr:hypothetical protein DFH09DRAFT_1090878 [Mycena vulgaris]
MIMSTACTFLLLLLLVDMGAEPEENAEPEDVAEEVDDEEDVEDVEEEEEVDSRDVREARLQSVSSASACLGVRPKEGRRIDIDIGVDRLFAAAGRGVAVVFVVLVVIEAMEREGGKEGGAGLPLYRPRIRRD